MGIVAYPNRLKGIGLYWGHGLYGREGVRLDLGDTGHLIYGLKDIRIPHSDWLRWGVEALACLPKSFAINGSFYVPA